MPNPRFSRQHHRRPRTLSLWRLGLITLAAFAGSLAALHFLPVPLADAVPIDAALPVPEAASPSVLASGPASAVPARARDRLSARFGLCHSGGGRNCVVDGDTFWFAGEKYRIADIDTPETHPARCAEEAILGTAATDHLRDWLNDGAFSLDSADRDSDQYGRKLRIVTRGGMSVGSTLVDAGLARRWDGARRSWC